MTLYLMIALEITTCWKSNMESEINMTRSRIPSSYIYIYILRKLWVNAICQGFSLHKRKTDFTSRKNTCAGF